MNELVSAVNGISAGWGAAIWRAGWQGTIALALAWGACRAWRGMPPHIRVWLWRLAYLKLVLGLLIWTRPVHLPVLPPSHAVVSVAAEPPSAELAADLLGGGTPAITLDAPGPVRPRPVVWLFALWLFGLSWHGTAVIRSWRKARNLGTGSASLDDPELERYVGELCRQQCLRPPRLAVGDGEGPLLLGIGRPTVLLPRALIEGCRPGELRLILAHEVAHLKGRDLTWNWLPLLGQWLFFFHPLVWLARREWRLAQEMAADAMAVQMSASTGGDYGHMLMKVVTEAGSCRSRLAAVGIAESRDTLKRRLLAVAHIAPMTRRWLMLAGIAIGVLALVVLVPWRLAATGGLSDGVEPVGAEEAEELLAAVRVGCEAAASAIQSGVGVISIHDTEWQEDGTRRETEATYQLVQRGDRARVLFEMRIIASRWEMIAGGRIDSGASGWWLGSDGEVVTFYEPERKKASVADRSSLFARLLESVLTITHAPGHAIPASVFDPQTWSGRNVVGPRVVGRETLDGQECVVVEVTKERVWDTGASTRTYRYWINPTRGFSLVSFESRLRIAPSEESVLMTRADIETSPCRDGLWRISSWRQDQYTISPATGVPYLNSRSTVTYAGDYQLNAPVTDDMLTIALPSGTKVHNELTDADYTVP